MSGVCRALWNQKCQTRLEKLLQTKKDYRSRLLFLNLQSAIEKVAYPQREKPFWSIKIGHFGYNADPMDSIKEKSLSHCITQQNGQTKIEMGYEIDYESVSKVFKEDKIFMDFSEEGNGWVRTNSIATFATNKFCTCSESSSCKENQ
jgi:hypothetical protein